MGFEENEIDILNALLAALRHGHAAVITNEDRYLRMIYEIEDDNENVLMVAYNNQLNPDGRRKYPDKKINVNEIRFLYKYVGSLKREQL